MRILFTSFGGRFSDNPRALHEALERSGAGHDHVWLADEDHAHGFPPGLELVPSGGAAAVAALEAADLVVSNTHIELDWRKPAGTTYLQTWHGTPFKRIHNDVLWAPEGTLERLDRDIARWDVLLSPSPFATPLFRRAFAYDGEVLEVGAPRDDALLATDAPAVRAAVRERLGIPPGALAVLYAPTWRDDEFYADGAPLRLHLDPAALTAALPGAHLLLRAHYFMTGRLGRQDGARVHDVSYEPDVRELHLAADVLVTDYSSVLFDWVVTGKPLVLFAYDLERYRDATRGFNLDLFGEAPGPVVRTQAALLDVLGDVAALPTGADPGYAAFRARYCPLEDGHASDRVLQRLFRPPAAASAPPARGPARP